MPIVKPNLRDFVVAASMPATLFSNAPAMPAMWTPLAVRCMGFLAFSDLNFAWVAWDDCTAWRECPSRHAHMLLVVLNLGLEPIVLFQTLSAVDRPSVPLSLPHCARNCPVVRAYGLHFPSK